MESTLEQQQGLASPVRSGRQLASYRRRCVAATLLLLGVLSQLLVKTPVEARSPHRPRTIQKTHAGLNEYTYVTGNPGESKRSYPAPAGEEDCELLPETWSYLTGWQEWNVWFKDPVNPAVGHTELSWDYGHPEGTWKFSQVVGDDHTSHHLHWADMKNTALDQTLTYSYFWYYKLAPGWEGTIGVNRLYGAAFDIVLRDVSVTAKLGGPLSDFAPYVISLREHGIVCWHRWVDEDTKNKKETVENEIHCIDPASPFIKSALRDQIIGKDGFMRKHWGSPQYQNDLPQATQADWNTWFGAVRVRQKNAPNQLQETGLQWMLTKHPHIHPVADVHGNNSSALDDLSPP